MAFRKIPDAANFPFLPGLIRQMVDSAFGSLTLVILVWRRHVQRVKDSATLANAFNVFSDVTRSFRSPRTLQDLSGSLFSFRIGNRLVSGLFRPHESDPCR